MEKQIEKFSDLDSRWSWVVMMACFASLFVVGGTNYSIGLVHNILLTKYNDTQTNTALVGALHTSISNLAAPLSSILTDRFSVRVAIMTSGFLYTIGFLSTAFVSSLQWSVFTTGVIAGLGGATGWTASMVAPSFYFKKYLNTAQGISMAGNGAGMLGLPPILSWASSNYGSFGFFVALASVSIHSIVCGILIRPSQLEKHLHEERRARKAVGIEENMFKKYVQVLTTRSVVFYTLSMFFYGCGMYIVFVYLPNFCIRQGVTEMQASMVISVCGIASIFGRVIVGFLASFQSINEIILFSGSLFCISIATIFFPQFGHTIHGQLIYAAWLGFFFGCPYVTITPINVTFLGVGKLAAALGIELCGCGLGGVIGPIFAGMLAESTDSFGNVFILGGVTIALSSTFGFIPYFFKERHCDSMTINVDTDNNDDCSPKEKMLLQNSEVT
ncbi:hypothetical protein ACF0H5_013387 [Mactra antiquata]